MLCFVGWISYILAIWWFLISAWCFINSVADFFCCYNFCFSFACLNFTCLLRRLWFDLGCWFLSFVFCWFCDFVTYLVCLCVLLLWFTLFMVGLWFRFGSFAFVCYVICWWFVVVDLLFGGCCFKFVFWYVCVFAGNSVGYLFFVLYAFKLGWLLDSDVVFFVWVWTVYVVVGV